MFTSIRTAALALGLAAVVTVGANKPAEATHQIGHFAAGVGIGLLLGGAAANRGYNNYHPPGVYATPVYQPTCYWERRQFYDNYRGTYWRRVQVCS